MAFSQYNTEDGTETTHYRGETRVFKENGLYVVEDLGISAGSIRIDDTPIAFEGEMWVNSVDITHDPCCYTAGEIQISR